jgi:hypothetical protein
MNPEYAVIPANDVQVGYIVLVADEHYPIRMVVKMPEQVLLYIENRATPLEFKHDSPIRCILSQINGF